MRVQSLVQEDALEEEMETHSSTLGWETPRIEESGGLLSMGKQRVRHNGACTRKCNLLQCTNSMHLYSLGAN